MRIVFAAAVLVCVSTANALAQAPDAGSSAATVNPASYSSTMVNAPDANNAGTLAENADTTALTSSTYHQDGGLFAFFNRGHQ